MNYPKINIEAEKTANAIFYSIGSPMPSIHELVKWVEDQFGIKIWIGHGDGEHFVKISGLTYYDPATSEYKIWIKESDYPRRQNFTLCHEIAHVIRNSGIAFGFFDGDLYTMNDEERFCNRFAAAFLMPREVFKEKWEAFSNLDIDLRKVRMTSIFKVSGEALGYRLSELGMGKDLRIKKSRQ